MFGPFVTSCLVEHLLLFILRRKNKDIPSLRWLNKIPKCLRHLPLIQPIVSGGFLNLLHSISQNIDAKIKEYKDVKKELFSTQGKDQRVCNYGYLIGTFTPKLINNTSF